MDKKSLAVLVIIQQFYLILDFWICLPIETVSLIIPPFPTIYD